MREGRWEKLWGRDCKGGRERIPIAKRVRPVLRRGQRERAGSGRGRRGREVDWGIRSEIRGKGGWWGC